MNSNAGDNTTPTTTPATAFLVRRYELEGGRARHVVRQHRVQLRLPLGLGRHGDLARVKAHGLQLVVLAVAVLLDLALDVVHGRHVQLKDLVRPHALVLAPPGAQHARLGRLRLRPAAALGVGKAEPVDLVLPLPVLALHECAQLVLAVLAGDGARHPRMGHGRLELGDKLLHRGGVVQRLEELQERSV